MGANDEVRNVLIVYDNIHPFVQFLSINVDFPKETLSLTNDDWKSVDHKIHKW